MKHLIEQLESLTEASAAPRDVAEMLGHAVALVQNQAKGMDLSDRKQAVQVWGFLFGLLTYWEMGPDQPVYKRNQKFFKKPPSEEAKSWLKGVVDKRRQTLIRKALKKEWPEASEWMTKHKMGR
jgi:hypothetical protein